MKDTIIMVPTRSQSGQYELFGWGNRLASPSIVTENTITEGGETYKLLQTLPVETMVNNTPLVYVLKIEGLEDYIQENAPYLVNDVSGGSGGGAVTGAVMSVNTKKPDGDGNVSLTANDVSAMAASEKVVKTVNSTSPDGSGDVAVEAVGEAPSDGNGYVRKNNAWAQES